MSQINQVSIPIKMGSKQIKINYEFTYNNFSLTSSQLIQIVLKKLFSKASDLESLSKTYSIYENAFGVERLVAKNENILNLFENQTSLKSNVYFAIRKKATKTNSTKNSLNVKQCFRKLKKQQSSSLKVIEDEDKQLKKVNLHQEVEGWSKVGQLKHAYLKQIFQNEIILNEQIEKLECFDRQFENHQQVPSQPSKGFIKSIYSKLKNHQKKQPKQLNLDQSSAYLLDSCGESSSACSSRSTSSSKLDTLF